MTPDEKDATAIAEREEVEEIEEEAPEALEEIVIEEVSIDGMCGVY